MSVACSLACLSMCPIVRSSKPCTPAVRPLDLHCQITSSVSRLSDHCSQYPCVCCVQPHERQARPPEVQPMHAPAVRHDDLAPRHLDPDGTAPRNSTPAPTTQQTRPATRPRRQPPPDATPRPVPVATLRFCLLHSSVLTPPRALATAPSRSRNAPTMPMPTPLRHALLLLLLAAGVAAQPGEPWDRSNGNGGGMMMPGARQPPSFSAPMVVLLVALIATFFFIGFFSIYIRRCGGRGDSNPIPAAALLALSRQEQQQNQDQQQNGRRRGLDPDVLASFPAMTYAEARALREDGGKDAVLECAVCLSEFEDEERLRLLPECSHAFHPDCIGEWLAGHVTCPVCRRSLVPEEKPAVTADEPNRSGPSGEVEQQRPEAAVVIDVSREGDGEDEEERRTEAAELERIGSLRRAVRSRSRSGRPFSRAHSTGHSLSARLDGDLERFTLRLPERVRAEMVSAGEESLRRTAGARSARIGRSDRWPSFIARTFSSSRVPFWAASRRAPADAETAAAAQARTIHEKTGDGSVGSAKGSVRFDCLGVVGAAGARVGDDSEDEPEEEKAIAVRPASLN